MQVWTSPPAAPNVRIVSKARYPWILTGILVVAWAGWHLTGLILASTGLFIAYFLSLRLHPRIRHGRCNGSGEVRGSVFTWTFRKCGRCNGGRLIRWGAGIWGSDPIRRERQQSRARLASARQNNTWR